MTLLLALNPTTKHQLIETLEAMVIGGGVFAMIYMVMLMTADMTAARVMEEIKKAYPPRTNTDVKKVP